MRPANHGSFRLHRASHRGDRERSEQFEQPVPASFFQATGLNSTFLSDVFGDSLLEVCGVVFASSSKQLSRYSVSTGSGGVSCDERRLGPEERLRTIVGRHGAATAGVDRLLLVIQSVVDVRGIERLRRRCARGGKEWAFFACNRQDLVSTTVILGMYHLHVLIWACGSVQLHLRSSLQATGSKVCSLLSDVPLTASLRRPRPWLHRPGRAWLSCPRKPLEVLRGLGEQFGAEPCAMASKGPNHSGLLLGNLNQVTVIQKPYSLLYIHNMVT